MYHLTKIYRPSNSFQALTTQNVRRHRHRRRRRRRHRRRGSCTLTGSTTLVVVLAQPAPEPQHPVIVGHGNEPNTLGLVVKQVAESCHESLVAEATLGHDSVI